MTTTSTDLLNDYARQIRVVTECAHALETAKVKMVKVKSDRLRMELQYAVNDDECITYCNPEKSNAEQRADRRKLWMLEHLGDWDTAVSNAEHDVAEAEIALEEARYRRTLLRLSLEADHDTE